MVLMLACTAPPERPPEVPVAFDMKATSSATTSISELPDGRVQIRVEHDLLRGVTPEMLMWFYENLPAASVDLGGQRYPLYRIWHPRDHVAVTVVEPASSESLGLSKGATIRVQEFVGDDVLDMTATMHRRDEGGTRLVRSLGPVEFMSLEHSFRESEGGVRVVSTGVIGSTVPIVGPLLNLVARRMTSKEQMQRLFRHMIEEFGNLEFFLPALWSQRDAATLRLSARPASSASE